MVPSSSPEGASDSPVPVPRMCPSVPAPRKCLPFHRFQPVVPPPLLSSGSPSACPESTIIAVRAPRDHPPVSPWLESPSPLPPARPVSLWLYLGLASTILCFGTPFLWIRLVPTSLWLHQAPPFPWLDLSPLSLWLPHGLLDPHLQ
ncbi:vegetative cell wall protein gp1-like [Carassius auratus]|uniref:Vegetative cell wall protein gp1-like n=1 Tax=Carassius auratus TaxID=7957 RepID=A0A6P6L023_CARAU|nr:vegetative cell wall protein gp1-like [Carassius auratus]